jgi:hypothetical protein
MLRESDIAGTIAGASPIAPDCGNSLAQARFDSRYGARHRERANSRERIGWRWLFRTRLNYRRAATATRGTAIGYEDARHGRVSPVFDRSDHFVATAIALRGGPSCCSASRRSRFTNTTLATPLSAQLTIVVARWRGRSCMSRTDAETAQRTVTMRQSNRVGDCSGSTRADRISRRRRPQINFPKLFVAEEDFRQKTAPDTGKPALGGSSATVARRCARTSLVNDPPETAVEDGGRRGSG